MAALVLIQSKVTARCSIQLSKEDVHRRNFRASRAADLYSVRLFGSQFGRFFQYRAFWTSVMRLGRKYLDRIEYGRFFPKSSFCRSQSLSEHWQELQLQRFLVCCEHSLERVK